MTRTTTGHPTRALGMLGAAMLAWLGYRVPAMETAFDAAMRAGAADGAGAGRPGSAGRSGAAGTLGGATAPGTPLRSPAREGPHLRPLVAEPAVPPPRLAVAMTPAARPAANPTGLRPVALRGAVAPIPGTIATVRRHSAVAVAAAGSVLATAGAPTVPPVSGDTPTVALAEGPPPRSAAPRAAPAVAPLATPEIVAAVAPARPPDPGAAATAAYAALAAGDRRGAVRGFDVALAGGSDDPRAPAWAAERRRLSRAWSASAYTVVRAAGDPGLAARPLLGGGQSGAQVGWSPDPLAPRPLALTARITAANAAPAAPQAAVGVRWQVLPGVSLAAERLIALDGDSRGDWTVRLASGGAVTRGRGEASAYAEAGVVGPTAYAAAQGRVGAVAAPARGVTLGVGAGGWASVQSGRGATVDRLDLGPGVVARTAHLSVAFDWRFRVAGNAAPGSGPVLTVTTGF